MKSSDLWKVSVVLVCLSFFLPWASRWEMNAHLFLYGFYTPISGFRSYGVHWLWTIPLMCLISGLVLILGGGFTRPVGSKIINASLNIAGSNVILFAVGFFLVWFTPIRPEGPVIVTLEAKPSLGFFLAILGAFLIIIGVVSDLIELWSE